MAVVRKGAAHRSPAVLDGATLAFLDSVAREPEIATVDMAEARAFLGRLQAQPTGRPGASIEELVLPVGSMSGMSLRILRPRRPAPARPAVMLLPGGWWALGDGTTHDRLAREIAVGVDAAIVAVGYPRPPRARYPDTV